MRYIIFYVRYYACLVGLYFTIWSMPECPYKEEFKKRIYSLRDEALEQQKERESGYEKS